MPEISQTEITAPEGLEPAAHPTEEAPAPTGLEALSPAELAKMVKELRSESAAHRTKLNAFEKAEEERQAASLTELEKAQNAAQAALEARSALEVKLAKRDALSALKSANVVDPDLAYLAIRDQITLADGEPNNLDELVKAFVAERPQMVKEAPIVVPDTKPTNPAAPADTPLPNGRTPGRL